MTKEGLQVDGLDALLVSARRLRELDVERFERVLSLCRAYVAVYDRPDEMDDVFASRVAQIHSATPKASA